MHSWPFRTALLFSLYRWCKRFIVRTDKRTANFFDTWYIHTSKAVIIIDSNLQFLLQQLHLFLLRFWANASFSSICNIYAFSSKVICKFDKICCNTLLFFISTQKYIFRYRKFIVILLSKTVIKSCLSCCWESAFGCFCCKILKHQELILYNNYLVLNSLTICYLIQIKLL